MRVEISKRTVLINSISSLLEAILSMSVLLWLQQFLARRISSEELAVFYVVNSLMMYFPLINMIAGGGVARFVMEAYARGDDRRVTQIISSMFPVCLAAGAVVLLVGLAVAFSIEHWVVIEPQFLSDARLMFVISIGMLALHVSYLPFSVGFWVRQKFMAMHLIALGVEVLRNATLFALLFGFGPRALWIVVASVPANLLSMLVKWRISRRLVPALRFHRKEIRRELIRPIFVFQSWNLLARVATITRVATIAPLLKNLGTAAEVVSYRWGSVVETRLFPTALSPLGTVQPALTAMYATGQIERLRRHYFRFSRYVLWAFLFLAVPLIAYQEETWRLYLGPKYEEYHLAGTVMSLLFLKSFYVFPQPVVAQVALAQAKNKPLTIRTFAIEALTALSIWYAIAAGYGPTGVALTIVIVGAITTPLLHWTVGLELTRSTFGAFFRETILPGMIPTVVAFPIAYALHVFFSPSTWIALGLQCALVEAVYVGVILAFCLNPSERADLRKVLAKARSFLSGSRPAQAG